MTGTPTRRGALALLALPALITLALPPVARAAEEATPVAASAPASALPVTVVDARMTAPERSIRLTGTIEALDSYPAGFRDGGRVISVAVDVGDEVQKGDEIARVDPTRTEAALRAARASVDATQAALDQADQARTRAESLLERGSGTQADLDSATEAYLTARAARDQAEAQLATARRAFEDTILTAVDDAIVTDRSAEPGQVVGEGQPIVTLASLEGREAVFLTPDDPRLSDILGQEVAIRPLEGEVRLRVPVTEVSPVVAETGTVTAKAAITGDVAHGFTIGEAVIGELRLTGRPVISVPWTALTSAEGAPAVWLLPEGSDRVELQQIEIEGFTRDRVEVASGLTGGDRVVAEGSHALFPGRQVIVLEDAQ